MKIEVVYPHLNSTKEEVVKMIEKVPNAISVRADTEMLTDMEFIRLIFKNEFATPNNAQIFKNLLSKEAARFKKEFPDLYTNVSEAVKSLSK